ncbi:TPA: ATP-binding protein, partial [Pseudomonas aeruginosa]
FLAKLMMLTQWYALANDKKVTPSLYQKVYDQQMIILHRPIEALRSNDPLQIADFEDMMPAREQVSYMITIARARQARRGGAVPFQLQGLPARPSTQFSDAATAPAGKHLAAVADPSFVSDAQRVAESDDWEATAKEKGFTRIENDIVLW